MYNFSFKLACKFVGIGALFFALLSFNWDRVELEGRAFVVAIGIDANEEGEGYAVAMSIANIAAIEGEEGSQEGILKTATGISLAEAMGQIDAKISDKVYYGHTKAIVIGQSVLEYEDMLREVVGTLERESDINTKTIIMATDKTAKQVLETKPDEQSLIGLYLSRFYNANNANTAAFLVKLDLEGLISGLRASGGAVIPKVTVKDDTAVIAGVMVLSDYSLKGYIEEEAMAGYLWLMANGAGSHVAIDADDGHTTLLVEKSSTKLRFSIDEGGSSDSGGLRLLADFNAHGSIEGARFYDSGRHDEEKINGLQRSFEDKIKAEIEEIFFIFRDDFGFDGLGLRELMRKGYPRLYEMYGGDFINAFRDMEIFVEADVLIRNT